jgi:hypothetical protein
VDGQHHLAEGTRPQLLLREYMELGN